MLRKKGTVFIIAGLILLAIAAGLVTYNVLEAKRAEIASRDALAQLTQVMGTEDWKDEINPDREMPTREIDGYLYIGTLEIPSLDLKLPIMEEWDYPRLRIAPCRYEGSAYKNNMIIAGHNYPAHFGGIRELPVGTKIRFTDVEGNVFDYTLEWIDVLKPYQTEEMSQGDWDLSLFTCTYDLSSRHVLRCVRDFAGAF
ncbi:MAG: sortase [Eubacteriaceae bacterium]|nr:sortase [Eubacteriaceae bacterium]